MRAQKVCVITASGKRVCGRPVAVRASGEIGGANKWFATTVDDRVYAVNEYYLTTEPVMIRRTYVLADMYPGDIADGTVLHEESNNVFVWGTGYMKRRARAKDRVTPVKTEDVPIPRPKVRANVQTKWNDSYGQWEKLTAKGWVPA